MRDGRDLRAAPGLIKPDRPNNVRDQGAGIIDIVGNASYEYVICNFSRIRGIEIGYLVFEGRRVLNRDGRCQAIAELLRVANLLVATGRSWPAMRPSLCQASAVPTRGEASKYCMTSATILIVLANRHLRRKHLLARCAPTKSGRGQPIIMA
jgi:hypothetical protein